MQNPEPFLDHANFACATEPWLVASVDEEYFVVERHAAMHYGLKRAFPVRQKLKVHGDRTFDILYLDLPDGSVREYWFDITSFYGQVSALLEGDDENPN